MNKNEAMKLMIDGKKIIEKGKNFLHYYSFENGQFYYTNATGGKIRADMPEHNDYEVFQVKKTVTQVAYVTTKALEEIKENKYGQNICFMKQETERARNKVRISWEEVEA